MNFKIITILSFACLVLGSCAVNKEYEKALQLNSISGYQTYQNRFSHSKYKADVQARLDKLLEFDAWNQACKVYTIDSFQNYLNKYPFAAHSSEAAVIIKLIDYNNKLDASWRVAQFRNTIYEYNLFILNYPYSKYEDDAKHRIYLIQESIAWSEAAQKKSIQSYSEYIDNFPNGENIWSAQAELKLLLDFKYKPLWDAAVKKNTIQGYKDFCANNPNSSYVQEAWNKIAQIENSEWDKTTKKNTIQGYKDFIKKFPYNTNVAEAEKRIIDLEVDQIFKGEHGELPPLSKSGYSTYSSTSQVSIFNNTEYTLTIRYSGRESLKIVIPPKGHDNRTLQSGDYRITASVNAANITNYAGSEYLSGGEYDSEYYIKTETYRSYQTYRY
jgi:outer membrane protein assembly factor BamD (BamD/ComL family)